MHSISCVQPHYTCLDLTWPAALFPVAAAEERQWARALLTEAIGRGVWGAIPIWNRYLDGGQAMQGHEQGL